MTKELIDQEAIANQMRDVNRQIEDLRKKSIEISKTVFHTAVSNFFNAYPEVAAIRWRQYTPYFNDGDTCEFSVHDLEFYSEKDYEALKEGELDDTYEFNSYRKPSDYVYRAAAEPDNKYRDHYQKEIDKYDALVKEKGERFAAVADGIEQFNNLFNEIDDDVMLSLFGDHVQITVTKDGIDVDEYDHD